MTKKNKTKTGTRAKRLDSVRRSLEELYAIMTSELVKKLTTAELLHIGERLTELRAQADMYFVQALSTARRQLVKPVKRKQAARRRS